jgi:hypothetical protein
VKGYGQWNTCVRNAFTQQYTACSFSSLQAPCTKATATATEYKSNELLFSTAKYRLNFTAFTNAYTTEDLLFTKHSKQIETQTSTVHSCSCATECPSCRWLLRSILASSRVRYPPARYRRVLGDSHQRCPSNS